MIVVYVVTVGSCPHPGMAHSILIVAEVLMKHSLFGFLDAKAMEVILTHIFFLSSSNPILAKIYHN